MGGLVAYEMARHLSEVGYRVCMVASFDTHLPARQPATVNENRASDARHKENMLPASLWIWRDCSGRT